MANEKDLEVKRYNNLHILTMFPVVQTVLAPHAFDDPSLKNILVDYLHENHLSQLRIAETEKYPHVTFFFDGGKEVEYDDMKKILIPSPKVATYDLKPEMSAFDITENLLPEIGKFDVVILNFANGDMLGHTGNMPAAVRALEACDVCIEKILEKAEENFYELVITSDHGNVDYMKDSEGNVNVNNSDSKVPLVICNENIKLKETGKLSDVVPTIIDLYEISKPKEMTGESLIIKTTN